MTLMNPFEEIATAIPLNQISGTMEINLLKMMEETYIPEPVQPVDGEYFLYHPRAS